MSDKIYKVEQHTQFHNDIIRGLRNASVTTA